MPGTIHCPREEKLVPFEVCIKCEYVRKDDDVSNIWCRYLIGKRTNAPRELRDLMFQYKHKEEEMNRAYKIGHTRKGDRLSAELAKLDKEIKKMKGGEG